eukprot:TRINITY_DN1696_c0_g1_i1.p1 TRINITY_DN1696_c0_g1~~TRINITY_DN1696_c0_g1_i1.p1  ORF type:complete len:109 (+),score=14.29 TRINITY_DN1696_c0_g1_i1:257-583(+)
MKTDRMMACSNRYFQYYTWDKEGGGRGVGKGVTNSVGCDPLLLHLLKHSQRLLLLPCPRQSRNSHSECRHISSLMLLFHSKTLTPFLLHQPMVASWWPARLSACIIAV